MKWFKKKSGENVPEVTEHLVPTEILGVQDGREALVSSEDELIAVQMAGLRDELHSVLPEPSQFLTFKGLDAPEARADGGAASAGEQGNKMDALPPKPSRRVIRALVVGGLALTLLAGVATWAYMTYGRVTVPDLVGMSSGDAVAALNDAGLRVGTMDEQEAPGIAPGRVINQDPMVDVLVVRGASVNLTIATESNQVSVPDLTGKIFEEAQAILSQARLVAEEVRTFDNTVPAGSVVGFLPTAGSFLPAGSTVSVLVSIATLDESIEIPSVIGMTLTQGGKGEEPRARFIFFNFVFP